MKTLYRLLEELNETLREYDYDDRGLFYAQCRIFIEDAIHSGTYDSPTQAVLAYMRGQIDSNFLRNSFDPIAEALYRQLEKYRLEYRQYQQDQKRFFVG